MMLQNKPWGWMSLVLLLGACSGSGSGNDSAHSPTTPQAANPVPTATVASPATTAHFPPTPTDATSAVTLRWDNLDGMIGKYPPQLGLLTGGPVTQQINAVLGNEVGALMRDLSVAGPLQRAGDVYYITGNAEHEGGLNQAYVLIDPAQKAVEVGLWRNGKLRTYTTEGAEIVKPQDVQTMIANAADNPVPVDR